MGKLGGAWPWNQAVLGRETHQIRGHVVEESRSMVTWRRNVWIVDASRVDEEAWWYWRFRIRW